MQEFTDIQFVLFDIEGTTTTVEFVHKTLFPYARRELPAFVKTNHNRPEVKTCLDAAAGMIAPGEPSDVVAALLNWIDQDRKITPLKTLQGLIWEAGYQTGAFKSHVYPDVKPCWQAWREHGLKLGIYSSGSVQAQKLLFSHTTDGDLSHMLEAYFDTTIGAKREPGAYRAIAAQLDCPAANILFLSDIAEELTAAEQSGMQTAHVIRPGTADCGFPRCVASFQDLSLS